MELLRTEDFYIFVKGENSLWWDRQTGIFVPKSGWELTSAEDPVCLGICYGIIGKVEYTTVFDPRLLIVKECTPVGKIHGQHIVYKIKSIGFLQLGAEHADLQLKQCSKHKSLALKKTNLNTGLFDIQRNTAFTKTWGTLKSAGNSIKNTTQQAAAIATGTPKRRDFKDKEKIEKRIIEEFHKIFTDTDSFYFCPTCDITNSLQRLCNNEKKTGFKEAPIWKMVDDRFFWNKHMLKDLIESKNPLNDPWILPIIQGYVQIEDCRVEMGNDYQGVTTSPKFEIFTLSIISRRSRFRAGTRYKRRGVDDNGECANYVETEQMITYHHHQVSFVQVRGSVPVYWSQPGYKYRPPPRIDKGEVETQAVFVKHFNKEMILYGPICIINLIEQTGKEKVIWDAYSNHIFQFNSPHITYCTFDFHEYCRGMHFENVSILINSIADIIRDMNYCWRDKQGHICSQVGIFRVNCIDCLDRTNVVQTALGKAVMEIQFTKLGLISPEGGMPENIKKTFQLLWANNGDIISKQYAGTNALKGDYTRTGERKFTGIMKDGVNSANRYYKQHFKDSIRQCCLDIMLGCEVAQAELDDFWLYVRVIRNIAREYMPDAPPTYIPHVALGPEFELGNALYYMSRYYLSRFKDSTRQGTVDLMLGNCVSEDIFSDNKAQQEEEDSAATAEHVKLLIEDCKKMLINNPEFVVGAWGLINADPYTGDPNESDMDSILILTRESYFVADYDDELDKITKYQRVLLSDITLLECGIPDTVSLFKTSRPHHCIRVNYKVNELDGYYHMFRSTNLRFFNNMAIAIKSEEEGIESLKSICEAFQISVDIAGLQPIPFKQGHKLDKRKSRVVNIGNASSNIYLDVVGLPNLTRNVSESQLIALKSAGSKALSNVTQQFSKLNKLSSPFIPKKKRTAKFLVGKGVNGESSTDSEEEYENSIFQPNTSVESASLQYSTDNSVNSIGNNSFIEQGIELTEDSTLFDNKVDAFLPSVGIVMGSADTSETVLLDPQSHIGEQSNVDNVRLSSIVDSVSIKNSAPEIQVNEDDSKQNQQTKLRLNRKLSRSSSDIDKSGESKLELDLAPNLIFIAGERLSDKRSNSEKNIALNIAQSQSESALKNKLANLTSPVAIATKDLVLNPFSKFAKGVQNLGSNLDPRKFGTSGVRQVSERELEEHRQMQERWRHSNTRLIAL
ncbi:phosphatidylinositide phosphatase SAC2 isoform X1 [Photinus pyralis]|uniref:phosphatidylinositide phosphatase SAC2 isoform X1 n=1 Tax=Photinus pyralis TaxID=7054 RepID=UPI00126774D2|nr:phosphatidylinositide phosphatase SAC2 isoform X1 [Photinus pyralis]